MKTKNKILAGVLAATTAISLCGCKENTGSITNSSSTVSSSTSSVISDNSSTNSNATDNETIVSDNIFSDITYMSSIRNIANADLNISFNLSEKFKVSAAFNVKGTEDIMNVTANNVKIDVAKEESEPISIDIPNINLIVDAKTNTTYITEDSFKSLMSLSGQTITYDNPAEWIVISSENMESDTTNIPDGIKDKTVLTTFISDVLMPEFTDAFSPIKDNFVGEDKHSITLDNKAITAICDTLISMCDDGSILNIYNKAIESKIIMPATQYADTESSDSVPEKVEMTAEEVVTKLKTALSNFKTEISNESINNSTFKITTNVNGKTDSLNANCNIIIDSNFKFTTDADEVIENTFNGKIDTNIIEGIVEVTIPTNNITLENYQTALMESMQTETNTESAQ